MCQYCAKNKIVFVSHSGLLCMENIYFSQNILLVQLFCQIRDTCINHKGANETGHSNITYIFSIDIDSDHETLICVPDSEGSRHVCLGTSTRAYTVEIVSQKLLYLWGNGISLIAT